MRIARLMQIAATLKRISIVEVARARTHRMVHRRNSNRRVTKRAAAVPITNSRSVWHCAIIVRDPVVHPVRLWICAVRRQQREQTKAQYDCDGSFHVAALCGSVSLQAFLSGAKEQASAFCSICTVECSMPN